jgi:DNA polymerase III epsilon subunit-like protein
MKILWLDIESTGLDCKRHGIIQAGFIIEIDGVVKEERVFKMNPVGCEMEPKALAINSYTPELIQSYSPAAIVKPEIEALFERYVSRYNPDDKFIAAGYNVGFDVDFMAALFERSGDVYFRSWIDAAQLDIMRVQSFLEWTGYSTKPAGRKLKDLGTYYDCGGVNSHDALDDIRLTREIALKMKELML